MTEDRTIPVLVRLSPSRIAWLDEWRRGQTDLPSRPEAIRRMLYAEGRTLGALLTDWFAAKPDERFALMGVDAGTSPEEASRLLISTYSHTNIARPAANLLEAFADETDALAVEIATLLRRLV